MKWTKRKIFRTVWIVCGVSFFIWMILSMSATGFDEEEIYSDSASVHVEQTDDFTSFTPTETYRATVLFYPGALVDPDAYAPLCRRIAEHGYRTLIIHMPWRLATQGYNKIKEMDLLADTTQQFILAGHSQGGKMAAQFVYENPQLIDRLILLGTTHPRDIDLSPIPIPVLKVYGSNDGVASPEKVIANKPMLPPSTQFALIEGGNHSQFGYYGSQLGDSEAGISREEQQDLILDHILSFLAQQPEAH